MDWRMTRDQTEVLARYNAEVARGLVHTEEWHAEMARLQEWFDEKRRRRIRRGGGIGSGTATDADDTPMTSSLPP